MTAAMNSSDLPRCALLSVSDKSGIVELGQALAEQGIQLLSTGGTAAMLASAGLAVTEVADHTGAAEMMAGRVKTLHPTVHGGILGRRGLDDVVMQERGIAPIDFVIVNLYPFAETVAKPDVAFADAVENIDIGGPAMLRSAAKNHANVMVVCNPRDYSRVIDSLTQCEESQSALRFDLAVKAFEHTARYDGMIADWMGRRVPSDDTSDAMQASHQDPQEFPRTWNQQFGLLQILRYGENPHQSAAFYSSDKAAPGTLAAAQLRQGKPLSYNNVVDADAALGCVAQFSESACVIVKHANPCGVSVADDLLGAYDAAYKTDPTSAFGGVIAFNRRLTAEVATSIVERQFVEVIVVPGVDDEALAICAKFPNVRVLDCEQMLSPADIREQKIKTVSGGLLVQDVDTREVTAADLTVVTERAPTEDEIRDCLFAWRVAKFVKSNAIVYCRDNTTVGIGAGQMSRVYSARIAGIKAQDEGLEVSGSVMASDAFFPFRDGIDNAAEVGITAVIQPGGSKNDQQVIDAANEHNMAMVFSGIRHFNH